jgi:hypothetical protein
MTRCSAPSQLTRFLVSVTQDFELFVDQWTVLSLHGAVEKHAAIR